MEHNLALSGFFILLYGANILSPHWNISSSPFMSSWLVYVMFMYIYERGYKHIITPYTMLL